jgi:hypothetical protein
MDVSTHWEMTRLSRQPRGAQQEAGAGEARGLAGALAGETNTASFAELAAATGGFAASRILGRGGFGPVYRGEWAGQAVAIKRLDHVRTPWDSFFIFLSKRTCSGIVSMCDMLHQGNT